MNKTRREHFRNLAEEYRIANQAIHASVGKDADRLCNILQRYRLEAVVGKMEDALSRMVNPLHNRQAIENAYKVLQEVSADEAASAKEKK